MIGVDQSAPANADAAKHFALNASDTHVAACAHQTRTGDAFAVLAELRQQRARFDVVIIDPPSFAKRQSEIEAALRSYAQLTRLGLDVLAEGGDIVLCSCSSRVSTQAFVDVVSRAAAEHRRPLSVREQTAHALDHPSTFAEASYLKAIFARA